MSKKNLFQLVACMLMACLCMLTSSCSKDESEDEKSDGNEQPADVSDGYEQTENVSNQDPEGTIVLNMNSGADGNWYSIGKLDEIHIDEANNFHGRYYTVSFVSVGLVNGLGEIVSIPTSGWAQSIAVVPSTGYVMRCSCYDEYAQKVVEKYARLYVVDYLGLSKVDLGNGQVYVEGSISGATIKYQAPFQLPIELDNNSLTFSSDASSQTLTMKNVTGVQVEKKPDWCNVSVSNLDITVEVTENLTASQRSGSIVLTNTANSVTLTIMQNGSSSPKFQAGSGTDQDPYQIRTAGQLKCISKALNAHFVLTANISLNEEEAGSGWDPIGKQETPFTGTLDGKGHTIKNMWMKRPTTNGVGLFGYMKNATIKNVRLEIADNGIHGGIDVGGICGSVEGNSEISQCSVNGTMMGSQNVGGICGNSNPYEGYYGNNETINISECYTDGMLLSDGIASGIVGKGNNWNTVVSNCYSLMSLTGEYSCYGISYSGTCTKSYYAGYASPGIYDYFYCEGTYTYYDISIIGTTRFGSEVNARTTEQMKTQSNYEGWDFTSIWKITEGETYPTLRCFDK